MPTEEVADFTTDGQDKIICQRCKVSFPKGTHLFYMHDRNPSRPGKYLCSECRQYQLQKTESLQRTQDQGAIHKQIAAAQRQGSSHPVHIGQGYNLAPGSTSQQYDHYMPPPPVPSRLQNEIMLKNPWPKRNDGQPHGGPKIFTPGQNANIMDIPDFFAKGPQSPGYQDAHAMYDEMLKVTLKSLKPGNKNPSIVSNITETIKNVPVHIGVQSLKAIAFLTIHPLFLKWSKGVFRISVDEVRLRSKDWVEMVPVPGVPDVDAIAEKFFLPKGKARNIQFQKGKGTEVVLEIEYEKYAKIVTYLEEIDENTEVSSALFNANTIGEHCESPPPTIREIEGDDAQAEPLQDSVPITPPRIGRLDAVVARKRQHSVAKTPPSAPQSKRLAPTPASPTAEDVRRALQAQKAPSKKVVKSLLNTVPVVCTVYPMTTKTFAELVAQAWMFNAISDCANPTKANIIFNPNSWPKYAAFKKATFGHTSGIRLGPSTHVCIKDCWYECRTSGARLSFDSPTQVAKLSSEMNRLRWASALMGLVYGFIAEQCRSLGDPPFEIPEMRFVNAALAVAETGSHDTYMLEEVIDEAADGAFVKYIGNSSVVPFSHFDLAITHRADFLAFYQHVQYSKTKGMAFDGDFQGGQHLLTDPQIITSSETGQNFADGNLASTHEMFVTDHKCNRFCRFFHLERLHKQSSHPAGTERLGDRTFQNQQHKTTPLFISTAGSAMSQKASGCLPTNGVSSM